MGSEVVGSKNNPIIDKFDLEVDEDEADDDEPAAEVRDEVESFVNQIEEELFDDEVEILEKGNQNFTHYRINKPSSGLYECIRDIYERFFEKDKEADYLSLKVNYFEGDKSVMMTMTLVYQNDLEWSQKGDIRQIATNYFENTD
ncbi:MAG: hypothetical protein ABEJ56_05395 [Candidatus Nanohaloarchaea archaeon]